ncbi:MAG: hypothetical protein QM730_15465 [Anaerolineales bacterium]
MDGIWIVWFILGVIATYFVEEAEKSRIQKHITSKGWMYVGMEYQLFRGLGDNRIFKAWFIDENSQIHEALFMSNFFKEVFMARDRVIRFEKNESNKVEKVIEVPTSLDHDMKLLNEKVRQLKNNK